MIANSTRYALMSITKYKCNCIQQIEEMHMYLSMCVNIYARRKCEVSSTIWTSFGPSIGVVTSGYSFEEVPKN